MPKRVRKVKVRGESSPKNIKKRAEKLKRQTEKVVAKTYKGKKTPPPKAAETRPLEKDSIL